MEITYQKWTKVQKNECLAWEKKKSRQEYFIKAHQELWQNYLNFLQNYIEIKEDDKILDIGCGPWGLISYIDKGDRYGLDPLMDYFSKEFNLPQNIKFLKGTAENIPFKDDFFDLVIITNVLDHVRNPFKIIKEIKRVLKNGGFLFFTVDCYGPLYRFYRILKEKVGLEDPYHPFTFIARQIKEIISLNNFEIIASTNNLKYLHPKWKEDQPIKTIRGQIYDLFFLWFDKFWDKNLLKGYHKEELILICKNKK